MDDRGCVYVHVAKWEGKIMTGRWVLVGDWPRGDWPGVDFPPRSPCLRLTPQVKYSQNLIPGGAKGFVMMRCYPMLQGGGATNSLDIISFI